MCEIWEEIKGKGMSEGLAKGEENGKYNSNVKSLENVMKKLHVNLKEAMDIIGLDESEYDLYASEILK